MWRHCWHWSGRGQGCQISTMLGMIQNNENLSHPKCLLRYCARYSSYLLLLFWLWVIYSFLLISAFLFFAIHCSPFDCLDRDFISVFLSFGPKDNMHQNHLVEVLKIQFHGPNLCPTESASRSPGDSYTVYNLLYMFLHVTRPQNANNIDVFLKNL